jgi:DegV family protein with EDD domain
MKNRIFIIDDDPIMGNLLASQLGDAGFEADYSDNGEEAVKKIFQTAQARSHRMVVLSDIEMPGTDGLEIRRLLRQNPETSGIPFVFLLSETGQSEHLRSCADECIPKPFNMDELLERIVKVTELAKKAEASRSRNSFGGSLIRTRVPDLLRIAELNCLSGEFLIKSPDKKEIGRMQVLKGKLIAAGARGLENEEAFFALAEEDQGQFEFHAGESNVPDSVNMDNETLLFKAGRMFEEAANLNEKIQDQDILLTIRFKKISSDVVELTGKENLKKILSLIRAGKTVREILGSKKMSRIRAASVINDLLNLGIITADIKETKSPVPKPGLGNEEPSFPSPGLGTGVKILQIQRQETVGENKKPYSQDEDEDTDPGDGDGSADPVNSPESEKPAVKPEIRKSSIADSGKDNAMPENSQGLPEPSVLSGSVIEGSVFGTLKYFEGRNVTGILNIKGIPTNAAIYFQDGQIIHAYHGKASGKKALFRILSEKEASLSFQSRPLAVARTLSDSLPSILQEASKEIGTLRRLKPETFDKIVEIPFVMPNISEIRDRPGLMHTLSLAQQYGKVRDIMEASQMTDLQTYKHLLRLVQMNILTVKAAKKAEVRIVTDSSSDLPQALIEAQNITLIPISVKLDGQVWLDGVNLMPENFYRAVRNTKQAARTVPPSRDDIHQAFRKIIPDKDILAIFLSGRMSKTVEYAGAAKDKIYAGYLKQAQQAGKDDLRIEIIDSRSVSLGLGLMVSEAADKLKEGWSVKQVGEYAEELIHQVRMFFVAESWEYLHRYGMVGKPRYLLGNLLRTRPVLFIRNGDPVIIDNVKGEENASELLMELIQESLPDPEMPIRAGVVHADSLLRAERLAEMLEARLNCRDIILSHLGPEIGARCGPGTVGVAYLPLPGEGSGVSGQR